MNCYVLTFLILGTAGVQITSNVIDAITDRAFYTFVEEQIVLAEFKYYTPEVEFQWKFYRFDLKPREEEKA